MLTSLEEASRRIRSGEALVLSGDAGALACLPPGTWVAGTIPYFMSDAGGCVSRDQVWVSPLPPEVTGVEIRTYGVSDIHRVVEEAPEHGFTLLILPAGSAVHLRFAQDAPEFPLMYTRPLLGWVSGMHLDDLDRVQPMVADGSAPRFLDDRAVAMHCALRPDVQGRIGILNLFRPGEGDTITFPADGFEVGEAWINGRRQSFAAYLQERQVDPRLPLVANYCGTAVNVAFKRVDHEKQRVAFFAPVFEGVTYRIAAPVGDYIAAFEGALPRDLRPVFCCNCVLNYLYGGLEGRATRGLVGPITFGEIAYQLLNQTLVYLTLEPRLS